MAEKDLPKALNIFIYSDLYDSDINAREWCCENVPHFTDPGGPKDQPFGIYDPIINDLTEVGKKLDITKADIQAIFTEIGANVNEETAHKTRALFGRWVQNDSYDHVLGFLLGYLRLAVQHSAGIRIVSQNLNLLEEDGQENLVVPCAIALAWCLLIETGVAADKGLRDNTTYMPGTLDVVISLDKLSRITKQHNTKNLENIFRTLMDVFVNNYIRYGGKRPHESEITYTVVTKNACKRVGIDPCDFVYRALDNDREDWALFAFLTENV